MTLFIGVITSIFMFSIIVLVHEGGHFMFARFFGVKVEEFGLGIPPRWKRLFIDKKGTLFSLNFLPLGGFVKLKGESVRSISFFGKNKKKLSIKELKKNILDNKDIFSQDGIKISEIETQSILNYITTSEEKDNLHVKPYWQQSLIIIGGVAMNLLLSSIIFSVLFFIGVSPIGINDKIETTRNIKVIPTLQQALEDGFITKKEGIKLYPLDGSLAQKAGIKSEDIVVGINGKKVTSVDDFLNVLSSQKNTLLNLSITRGKENVSLTVLPNKDGKIGSYVGENLVINENFEYRYTLVESIKNGFLETYNQSILTSQAFEILLKNIFFPKTQQERTEAINNISGPIGIISLVSESMKKSLTLVVILGSLVSINLAVFNILPIPALDGGRLLFIWIHAISEKVIGKKAISLNLEAYVHGLFFLTLIALSVIIGYNDILKFFQ